MTGPDVAGDVDALVAAHVKPGMHLHLAATPARPNALIYALARVFAGRGRFTISVPGLHSSAHALTLAGVVAHLITAFVGDVYPTPRPNPLYRDLHRGRPFTVELWSLLSLVERLMAGALGQPYAATASLSGSDLLRDRSAVLVQAEDPRDGRAVVLAPALRPDVTLLHGVCADEAGNVVMRPPLGEGAWSAYAARGGVLASVERLVPAAVVRRHSDRVVVPGQRVLGVCEAPLGAHPQGLRTGGTASVPGYRDDDAFLREAVSCWADPAAAQAWCSSWVELPGGHAQYLERLGAARREELTLPGGRPRRSGGWPAPATPTEQECLIILGARAVVDLVKRCGYDTLLAGIGPAHMAAWLASAILRARSHAVKVSAEIGLYGMHPAPGDAYLFSQRHIARCEQLSGVAETLGGMVASNARCLGVLSAAEVDERGDINTTLLPDGRWVTGSGGANDIASTADCVVVAHASPRRYVPTVAHVTSPGRRVREVVCQFGRFRRSAPGGAFELVTWLRPQAALAWPDDPTVAVRQRTGWTTATASALEERPITAKELRTLRSIDHAGDYR